MEPGSKLAKLMRKDAFLEEEKKGGYMGESDGRLPTLSTPPHSTAIVAEALEGFTPSPIGIETVHGWNMMKWFFSFVFLHPWNF